MTHGPPRHPNVIPNIAPAKPQAPPGRDPKGHHNIYEGFGDSHTNTTSSSNNYSDRHPGSGGASDYNNNNDNYSDRHQGSGGSGGNDTNSNSTSDDSSNDSSKNNQTKLLIL